MALDAILGGLFGGILRAVPEVLTFMDKKNERKHELALGDQQYRVAELQFRSQKAIKDVELEQSQFVSAMEALKTSITAQAVKTGIPWIDAISSLVRPAITGWIFTIYSAVKVVSLAKAMDTMQATEAVLSIWGPADTEMLSAVVMFWFVGRVWDKAQGV